MRGSWLLWFLLVPAGSSDELARDCFCRLTPQQIERRLREIHLDHPDFTGRLEAISAAFLDTPYGFSPLGEGAGHGPDPDPLIRFDRVDCQTLVEEVLALSMSPELDRALEILNRIRYLGGLVEYTRRKHFVAAQWLPDNQRLGLLEDITERIGGTSTIWREKKLDGLVWRRRRPKSGWPLLSEKDIPQTTVRLPVIPPLRAVEKLHLVPSGSIMLVVREDRADKPVLVSHMGLVIAKEGRLFLRHASRKAGRVVDEELKAYLSGLARLRGWPVAGVNFQRAREFQPATGLRYPLFFRNINIETACEPYPNKLRGPRRPFFPVARSIRERAPANCVCTGKNTVQSLRTKGTKAADSEPLSRPAPMVKIFRGYLRQRGA
jgi:hypothetical protein